MTHRRAWLTLAAGILLLLLLRLIWGGIASHRLERELARARPAPLTPAELFTRADPDPANNAVPLLIEAMESSKSVSDSAIESPSQSNQVLPNQPPYPPAWHQLIDASVAANAKTFALARQARGRTKFHWSLPADIMSEAQPNLVHLNDARNLANLLGDAALDADDRGDHLEALRRIRDELHLARAVDRQHMFISHLVAIGICANSNERLLVIASGLNESSVTPAVREEMTALIGELSDESVEPAGLRDAFVAERIGQIETMRREASNTWATRPLYELDLARVLRADHTFFKAAEQSDGPAARAMLLADPSMPDFDGRRAGPNAAPQFSRYLGDRVTRFMNHIFVTEMRYRTERHFAATALAVALWRADHRGASPTKLDDLVPKYLKAVPRDAVAGNRPIGYLIAANPAGGDRHVLHSIGENGVDDIAAAAQALSPTPEYGWSNTGAKFDDQYRDLDRWLPLQGPPAPPPGMPTDAVPDVIQ